MFGFADLGMSNGLINMVAEAIGRERQDQARHAISSAFWILTITSSALFMCGLAAYPFLDVAWIFNVTSPRAVQEAGPALGIFALCFILQLPLGAVRGAQSGLQKGYVNNIWAACGALLSLAGMIFAIHFRLGLPELVLCISGPPLLMLVLNGVVLFYRSHPELRPRLNEFSRATAAEALHTGLMYFILQLAITIGVQTDNIVIAQILGAKAVAAYAVPARMFALVTSFLVMLSGVILPAYADAFSRQDGAWIKRTFFRVSIFGTIIALCAAVVLFVWGNRILTIWVGPNVQASSSLLLSFAALSVIYAYLQPINFLMNGIRRFRVPVICAIANAVLNLGLSILFVKHLGIIGAVLGTLTATVLVQVVPLTIETQKILKELVLKQVPRIENAIIS
jgi:O-antigen/teichoic acid export membrane protein